MTVSGIMEHQNGKHRAVLTLCESVRYHTGWYKEPIAAYLSAQKTAVEMDWQIAWEE